MLDKLPRWLIRLVLALAARWEFLGRLVNAAIINGAVNLTRNRPHPWSTSHDYVTWTGLSEHRWSARHLPPVHMADPPPPKAVAELFRRPDGQQRLCKKSTCLFPAFAQYLTDGFIRTRMPNTSVGEKDDVRRENTSNHQIDLCPLYGRIPEHTDALRLRCSARGERGRLRSQVIGAEEYAPFLFRSDGTIDPAFDQLDPLVGRDKVDKIPLPIRSKLFAFGGDRTNGAPQVAMLNTLLLREHNRLAGIIERDNPHWDDERVFQTARNTLIVIFIKLVVEDYINHIVPIPFKLRADAVVGYKARWYRTNWITTEFSLLYRWHSLLPDQVRWNGALHDVGTTLFRNDLMLGTGLVEAFAGFGAEPAGQLGAENTAESLLEFEERAILQGQVCDVAPYTDYRAYVQLKRPESFEEVTRNPHVAKLLKQLYGHPNRIEFYPGLFCEDAVENSPLPPLILRLVAVDAFSQALTNPLLSEHVFKEETFSDAGWKAIHATSSIADLLERNAPGGLRGARISMTRPEWKYTW